MRKFSLVGRFPGYLNLGPCLQSNLSACIAASCGYPLAANFCHDGSFNAARSRLRDAHSSKFWLHPQCLVSRFQGLHVVCILILSCNHGQSCSQITAERTHNLSDMECLKNTRSNTPMHRAHYVLTQLTRYNSIAAVGLFGRHQMTDLACPQFKLPNILSTSSIHVSGSGKS